MSITAALTHPDLLGRWYSGDSWRGWRTLARAIFGLQIAQADLEFFRSVTGGRDPPSKQVREAWILVGRRAGKDSITAGLVAYLASTFKDQHLLRPGERATVACLAVDRQQAGIVHGYICGLFSAVPALAAMVVRQTDDGLVLNNQVDILITTSDYRHARGRTYLAVVCDEICFWRSDEGDSRNPDSEILRGLRPGMSLPNSLLIAISSVHRRAGEAYSRWSKYFGQSSDRYLVVHAETRALNPLFPQAEIDEAMEDDPAAAKADYFSQWRDDLASFVPRDLIERSVDKGVFVREFVPGTKYYGFADFAEGASASGDSITCAIAHTDGEQYLLDAMCEIKPPFNAKTVTKQVAYLLKRYRCHEVAVDKHAVGFVSAELADYNIATLESPWTRSELYLELLPHFTSEGIRLLDSDRLVGQFSNLERRSISGGQDRVDHPKGMHDDLSNSVAGALVRCANREPGLANVSTANMQRAIRLAAHSMRRY